MSRRPHDAEYGQAPLAEFGQRLLCRGCGLRWPVGRLEVLTGPVRLRCRECARKEP